MAEQKLDLIQFAAREVAETGAVPTWTSATASFTVADSFIERYLITITAGLTRASVQVFPIGDRRTAWASAPATRFVLIVASRPRQFFAAFHEYWLEPVAA